MQLITNYLILNELVITSYSIHYTKLYDVKIQSSHRRQANRKLAYRTLFWLDFKSRKIAESGCGNIYFNCGLSGVDRPRS